MMKKRTRMLFLGFAVMLALLLSGCAEQLNPLVKNEATEAPGLAMEVYTASAEESNVTQIKATLYFRYLNEPMLAAESRVLTVRRDQQPEQAILEALIAGPSAGNADLRAIIPTDTEIVNITRQDRVLFVTFNEAFLQDEIPDDWTTDENWQTEAPLQRRLITQSIAASLTESYAYTGVQLLVYRGSDVQTSLRLSNEYFLDGSVGLSEPIVRDEALLLTPQTTVKTVLEAWYQRNYEGLYKYVAQNGKPAYSSFVDALSTAPTPEVYSVSGGSVYLDGKTAVVTVYLRLFLQGESDELLSYPLQLIRENDAWKIDYTRLSALMLGN